MRIAIIGSGPAGFYAAEALLKRTDTVVHVDLFDRLPTPYGLVRGGVAPDHQNIKAVIRVFEKTASRPTFRFLGNVSLGRDVSVEELRQHYHQIVYAIGNEGDRRLGIPGEGALRSTPSSVFIGWYNGHPDYREAKFDLSISRVAVVGNGNVAVDVARILLSNPEELGRTDIATHALNALRHSRVREVFMLGRRGPGQASFTAAELKELGELKDVEVIVNPAEFGEPAEAGSMAEKNLAVLREFAARAPQGKPKKLHLRFLVSPVEILVSEGGAVYGIELEKNRLEDRNGTLSARGTGEFETLEVGMVLSAVGFSASPIEGVPFDEKAHIIANRDGRVVDLKTGGVIPNEYAVGWARTGPQGLIGSHKPASNHVVEHMIADGAGLEARVLPEPDAILELLKGRGVQVVSFNDWKRLDEIEVQRGERRNSPRDKIVEVAAMLKILTQE